MLYKSSTEVASLKFNAVGTDNENWFSQNNLVQSPWTDLKDETNLHVFSIRGNARTFEISKNYGGCGNDAGWFLLTQENCDWENRHPKTSILYSKLSKAVNWNNHGMKNFKRLVYTTFSLLRLSLF